MWTLILVVQQSLSQFIDDPDLEKATNLVLTRYPVACWNGNPVGMAAKSGSFGMDMTIAGIKKRFSDVKNVDTETLHQWMNDTPSAQQEEPDQESSTPQRKLVLLDVRPAEEHAVSSIPSAVRVDPEESDMQKVMQKIQESAPVSAAEPVNVVMYCSVGYRSSILASKFQDFVDVKQDQSPEVAVYNLEGSIFKWANEGRRLTDLSGGETRFVHPYSKIWGLLLDRDRRRYSPA